MYLADGREVPNECVAALDALENRWPGATLRQARGAIVAAVLAAYQTEDFEPSGWWKVVGTDSIFMIETKDEDQARKIFLAHPGSKLYRSFERSLSEIEWREQLDND